MAGEPAGGAVAQRRGGLAGAAPERDRITGAGTHNPAAAGGGSGCVDSVHVAVAAAGAASRPGGAP